MYWRMFLSSSRIQIVFLPLVTEDSQRFCSSIFFWKTLATASTCQLTMILPVAHGNNCNKFKQDLILSFKGNDGIGGL